MENTERLRFSSSSQNNINNTISGTCIEIDTQTDTTISGKTPILHDFGGDLKKRWYIDYYQNGKRERKWISSRPLQTRTERAKKELQKIKKSVSQFSACNLADVLEQMIIKKRTKDTYKADIKVLLSFTPDPQNFDAVEFKEYLSRKYHKNSIRNKIGSLKAVFSFGVSKGFLKENPFLKLEAVKKQHDSEFNYPFTEYERSILEPELEKVPELFLFTRFIYFSFSRVAELLTVRIKDIDLRTRTIKFHPQNTKSGKPVIKPIVKPLLDIILNSKVLENPSNYYLFGHNLKPDFKKCPANYPTNQHRAILQKLNIYRERETVLYSWKHTGNINAYLKGMDLKLIQKINAHSSIQTTEIYLRKLGLFLDKQAFDFDF